MELKENIQKSKQLLKEADAIFITAGAGMGVDRVQIFMEKMDVNESRYMRLS